MTINKVWRPLDRPELGGLDSISRAIQAEEWRDPGLLTSVRWGQTSPAIESKRRHV